MTSASARLHGKRKAVAAYWRAMSQENIDVVRNPLRVREQSNRTLDQRIALRLPRLAAACARLLSKLARASRVRQAALCRGVRLALEAYNRRDLDAVFAPWSAEFGQDWWTLHAEPQLAKVTLELYAMLWDVHILPASATSS